MSNERSSCRSASLTVRLLGEGLALQLDTYSDCSPGGQRTGTGPYVWPPSFVFHVDFADGPDSADLQMMALNAVRTLFFGAAKRSVRDLL